MKKKIYKSKTIKRMSLGTYSSMIPLGVSGLNVPKKKRPGLAEWIQNQEDSYIFYLKMTPFRCRDTYRLKVRGWKKVFHTNRNKRNTEIAINTYIRQNRL